jgi:hypothetical protein
MTSEQLKEYIKANPKSDLAAAYDAGMRDKAMELSPLIEKVIHSLTTHSISESRGSNG